MSNFLQKQASLVLERQTYAYSLAIILPYIPFGVWFSWVIISLITLRKGGSRGLNILAVSLTASLVASQINQLPSYVQLSMVLCFLLSYCSAVLLRASAGWKIPACFALGAASVFVGMMHGLFPIYLLKEFDYMLILFNKFGNNEFIEYLFKNNNPSDKWLLAHYLIGLKAFSILFSVFTALMLARFIQSVLFYPGAFKAELILFRANKLNVVFFLLDLVAAYQGNVLAISLMLPLMAYLTMAGLCLAFNLFYEKKGWSALIFLFLPLIIVPYIMLPIYVFFGSLDSMFNFRLSLLAQASNKKGV